MGLDLPQHIESRHVRQGQIQQQHVALCGTQQIQGLATRLGLAAQAKSDWLSMICFSPIRTS